MKENTTSLGSDDDILNAAEALSERSISPVNTRPLPVKITKTGSET